MNSKMRIELKAQLKIQEGYKLYPYTDTVGKITIGVGRNLTDVGLSKEEVNILLDHDIDRAESSLSAYDFYKNSPPSVQLILLNMCFNMGINSLLKFKSMIAYIIHDDFENASIEMLDSKWATQVGDKAIKLAKIMKSVGAK